MAAVALRASSRRSPQPALVGHRPEGQDADVRQARVLVEYRVRLEDPKSCNGKRTPPLDDELVAALTALRKLQMEESASAGTAYQSGLAVLDWYQGGEYVITDRVGTPIHPEWYSEDSEPVLIGHCAMGR
jgi:hypothetical protein